MKEMQDSKSSPVSPTPTATAPSPARPTKRFRGLPPTVWFRETILKGLRENQTPGKAPKAP